MPMTEYLAGKLMNHTFRGGSGGSAFSQPPSIYIALHSSNPGPTGKDNEVVGGSYSRLLVQFDEISNGLIVNSNNLEWTMPATTVTHFSLWDHGTVGEGNCLQYGETEAKTMMADDTYSLEPGAIEISRSLT